MKQTSSFQRWRRRYFKLKGRTLYYAKDTKVSTGFVIISAILTPGPQFIGRDAMIGGCLAMLMSHVGYGWNTSPSPPAPTTPTTR